MDKSTIQEYLNRLESELRWRGISDPEALQEIEDHLLDSIERGVGQGLSPEEAQQKALELFGSPGLIAACFEKETKKPMQKVYFIAAVMLGLAIAYIDSRPTWDDTGITVLMLLLGGEVIGLLAKKRPWLFALAFGLWIPAWNILQTHKFTLLPVLIFPFISVYAGWAVQQALRKTLKSAAGE